MSGDFSRSTFDPKKHSSGVRMQQGRVQLDADWNEQADIVEHAVRARTGRRPRGGAAAPSGPPGFGLVAESSLVFEGRRRPRGRGAAARRVRAPRRRARERRGHRGAAGRAAPGGPILSAGHLLLRVGGGREAPSTTASPASSVTTGPLSVGRAAPRGRRLRRQDGAHPRRRQGRLRQGRHGGPRRSGAGDRRGGGRRPATAGSRSSRRSRAGTTRRCGSAGRTRARGARLVRRRDRVGPRVEGRAHGGRGRGAPASRPVADEALVIAELPARRGRWSRRARPLPAPQRRPPGPARRGAGRAGAAPASASDRGATTSTGSSARTRRPSRSRRSPTCPASRCPQGHGAYLAVLDVWERIVDPLEDPSLLEVALGGVDTAARTKTVWQVRLVPIPAAVSTPRTASTPSPSSPRPAARCAPSTSR